MLNTLLFFGWVVIAVVVVWKRVHVHLTVELTGSPKRPRSKPAGVRGSGPQSVPEVQTASAEDCSKQDCISALVNLGCDRKQARSAVERACSKGPAEFDELLKRAIWEAA